MTSGQPKRKRGVVLTPTGRQKLQDAIKAREEHDDFGEKLTIGELSNIEELDAGTVSKVLDCEEGVDRRTLERFFQAFNPLSSATRYFTVCIKRIYSLISCCIPVNSLTFAGAQCQNVGNLSKNYET
jgi:uncharacterized 2Fe-2S/4Fe-4S cluster protein (DUF4445 family)